MKKLLIITLLLISLNGLGQEKTSSTSNSIQLDLNGIVPTISWVSPESYETDLTVNQYAINIGIKSQGKLKSTALYINDVIVSNSRGFKPSAGTGFDKIIDWPLTLFEGQNIIKVVATSEDGVEVSDIRVINVDRTSEVISSTRTDYALLFAINEYDEWDDLSNPVFDVQTIKQELETSYGFKTEVVINATQADIMEKLREYVTKSYEKDDQLFIFFAGHGQFDEVFSEGYLVGADSKLIDPGKTSYIAHSTLRNIVNNIPSNHIFISLDACFGGTFDPMLAKTGSRGVRADYNDITRSEFIARRLRYKTRQYVTSGGKEYVADGIPGSHSPYARKFLQALRGYGGQDKILTLQEIRGYLSNLKMEPHAGEFGDNEPGSDFVFVAR